MRKVKNVKESTNHELWINHEEVHAFTWIDNELGCSKNGNETSTAYQIMPLKEFLPGYGFNYNKYKLHGDRMPTKEGRVFIEYFDCSGSRDVIDEDNELKLLDSLISDCAMNKNLLQLPEVIRLYRDLAQLEPHLKRSYSDQVTILRVDSLYEQDIVIKGRKKSIKAHLTPASVWTAVSAASPLSSISRISPLSVDRTVDFEGVGSIVFNDHEVLTALSHLEKSDRPISQRYYKCLLGPCVRFKFSNRDSVTLYTADARRYRALFKELLSP
jgi:hypothetical protein